MKIQRTNINEGVDDNKLTPQDKQVVKKVLDVTGGDMVAAAAVGQAKIAQKDKIPGNEQLKEGQEAKEISADVCRSNGYMIGKIPYVCIQEDALQILDYVRAPYNFAKLIKKGQFYIDFEDICDGVYERLNYEGAKASDAAYALKKFFEDNGVPVEDTPEEGSRAAEYEDEPEEQLPRSRKRKPFFSLDNESLEEDLYDSEEDVEFQNEVDSIIDAESDNQSSSNCINDSATAVMEAYQNANKWLDTIKEFVYSDLSCVFFSSFIHGLAHTMPERFDKFGDILHTLNIKVPYPATQYIPQEPQSIDDVFSLVFMILNSIKTSLNNFIKCTDDEFHGAACAAEALLNDIESEYPMWYRLKKEWELCNEDTIKFDKYVNQYVKSKGDLLESLNSRNRQMLEWSESNIYDLSAVPTSHKGIMADKIMDYNKNHAEATGDKNYEKNVSYKVKPKSKKTYSEIYKLVADSSLSELVQKDPAVKKVFTEFIKWQAADRIKTPEQVKDILASIKSPEQVEKLKKPFQIYLYNRMNSNHMGESFDINESRSMREWSESNIYDLSAVPTSHKGIMADKIMDYNKNHAEATGDKNYEKNTSYKVKPKSDKVYNEIYQLVADSKLSDLVAKNQTVKKVFTEFIKWKAADKIKSPEEVKHILASIKSPEQVEELKKPFQIYLYNRIQHNHMGESINEKANRFPTMELRKYKVILANKDECEVYATSERDAWDEADNKYGNVENVYLDEALYEEANDTTSCKMEMCKDLTDADEYVVDSALSELEECRNCDQQEVSSVVMDLCKNIDTSEFDNDPDFDRCVDFVTTLLSEGYKK